MSSPSAPPSADAAPAAPVPEAPPRPRRVAAGFPVWRERLVGLGFLGAAAGLWLFAGRLTAVQQGALWAGLLLALAAVVRLGGLPLLGPVFAGDLVRTTRRGRYALLRCVYAVGLFLFLLLLYRVQPALGPVFRAGWLGAGGMARFAETFCYTFLAVQFAAVVVLAPAYVAGAVAEEKERKTLEFLLATDVRDREIVLGKMASRVANLALLLLTGLPVLSLTQLWGGVDLGLILAAFAATGLTLLSLAAVSMLASVHSRRARDAVVLAYLVAAGYAGVSVLAYLLNLVPAVITYPLTRGATPYTVNDVVERVASGNAVLAAFGLRQDLATGLTLQEALPARLSAYAAFHLLVVVVCTGWAVLRLRPLALLDAPAKVKPQKEGRRHRFGWRPRLGRSALLWKEVWAEPGMTFNRFGKAVVLLIVLCSFVPAVWLGGAFLLEVSHQDVAGGAAPPTWAALGQSLNLWVRIVGTLVACLTLLGVAVRAASSISGERERQTFDSLLTAPLDSDRILFAKWVGSVLSVRRAWLWLCLVWLLPSLTGGLYGPTVSWLVLTWFVYAGFLAVLGLLFSMTCRTTLRATVGTLLTAAVLGGGHWYLWLVFCLPLRLRDEQFEWAMRVQAYGFTPPLALGWLMFRSDNVESVIGVRDEDPVAALLCLLGGLLVWSVAGYVLWRVARRRFRVLTGRVPVPVPAGAPPLAALTAASPVEPAAPAPPRRRRRVLFGLLGAAALLAAGWGVWCAVSADLRLNEELDGLDRADPGWRLADLETRRRPVPDGQNGGACVLAVRGLMPWRWNVWPTQQLVTQLDDLPPEVRLSPEQHGGITNDLEEVEEALLAAEPLADLPQGRYTVNWAPDIVSTPMPHLDACQAVRRLVWYDLMLRAEEGDPDGALVACRRLLNLGRSVGDEPFMISQSVRLQGARGAVRGVQRVLAHGEPSEALLADLQRRLAEEEAHPGLLIGARGERAGDDEVMAQIQAGDFPWQTISWFAEPDERRGRDWLDAMRFSLTPGSEKDNRARLLRYQSELVAAAALPPEEQGPAFDRLEAERDDVPLLARQLGGHAAKVGRRYRQWRAELRCAVAALAAERFRRKHGRWPEQLAELVRDYLEKVPADPFTGGPLRLRRLADGVVIYSVGSDGADDGGDVKACPDTSKVGKDLGVRLWDGNRRRQDAAAGPAPR